MRDSSRPIAEQQAIGTALNVLAIATRDTSIDAGVIRVYMPHLDDFTVAEIRGACEALHLAQWFPKCGELVAECRRERGRQRVARDAQLAATAPKQIGPPPDLERRDAWLARLREAIGVRTR